jgi:hypothetical protein
MIFFFFDKIQQKFTHSHHYDWQEGKKEKPEYGDSVIHLLLA